MIDQKTMEFNEIFVKKKNCISNFNELISHILFWTNDIAFLFSSDQELLKKCVKINESIDSIMTKVLNESSLDTQFQTILDLNLTWKDQQSPFVSIQPDLIEIWNRSDRDVQNVINILLTQGFKLDYIAIRKRLSSLSSKLEDIKEPMLDIYNDLKGIIKAKIPLPVLNFLGPLVASCNLYFLIKIMHRQLEDFESINMKYNPHRIASDAVAYGTQPPLNRDMMNDLKFANNNSPNEMKNKLHEVQVKVSMLQNTIQLKDMEIEQLTSQNEHYKKQIIELRKEKEQLEKKLSDKEIAPSNEKNTKDKQPDRQEDKNQKENSPKLEFEYIISANLAMLSMFNVFFSVFKCFFLWWVKFFKKKHPALNENEDSKWGISTFTTTVKYFPQDLKNGAGIGGAAHLFEGLGAGIFEIFVTLFTMLLNIIH